MGGIQINHRHHHRRPLPDRNIHLDRGLHHRRLHQRPDLRL